MKRANEILYQETEKNRVLSQKVEKSKFELTRLTKWNKSSEAMNWVLENQNKGKQGLGFKKPLPPYNPKSKYVALPCNMLCTFCGETGHVKQKCINVSKAKAKN